MKVAVLTGGEALECELSLASAKHVCAALEEAGHRAVLLDIAPDLVSSLRSERPDVCFVALHGARGENGSVQSVLEFVGIPFVGSSSSTCQRAWSKSFLPSEMAAYHATTGDEPVAFWPQGFCIAGDAFGSMGAAAALDLVEDRVIGGYPVAVKPAHGASARGVHRVDSIDAMVEAVSDALSFDNSVIVEQWVEGVEVMVPVLGTGWDAYALPPVEIVAKRGFYDADARLAPGAMEYYTPVRPASLANDDADAQAIRAEIERAALEVCRAYQVRDLAQVSLIWDGAQARVLGVSVSPDMAETALFPVACEAAGLSLPGVLDELIGQYA